MLGCKVQQNYSHTSMNIRASRKKHHQTKKMHHQKEKHYQKQRIPRSNTHRSEQNKLNPLKKTEFKSE